MKGHVAQGEITELQDMTLDLVASSCQPLLPLLRDDCHVLPAVWLASKSANRPAGSGLVVVVDLSQCYQEVYS